MAEYYATRNASSTLGINRLRDLTLRYSVPLSISNQTQQLTGQSAWFEINF